MNLRRALWAAAHVAWSAFFGVWFALTRRRGVLVFTHFRDRDADGRDRQMGPLVEALAARDERLIVVSLVPLGRELFAQARGGRCAYVSLAALRAVARMLSPGADRERRDAARVRVAGWALRAWRPRAVFLIDESGSGQALLRAARRLGIRTVGVQHGDFRTGDPRYDLGDNPRRVEPADVLCVWSEWFCARLWALSPIYSADNTLVTGRMRYAAATPEPARGSGVRVLVLGEADATAQAELAPFVAALCAADLEVSLRPHPAITAEALPDLAGQFTLHDVVVGRSSSALLEAAHFGRPAIAVGAASPIEGGVGARVADPAALAPACRALAAAPADALERLRQKVWGDEPADAAERIATAAATPTSATSPAAQPGW